MSRLLIILFFPNTFLLSCKNEGKIYIRIPDSSMLKLKYTHTNDSIIRRNQRVAFLKELSKLMKLQSIDHLGERNFIRIWNWSLDTSNYVAEITYKNNENAFSLFEWGSYYSKDSIEYILIHEGFSNLKPKISWDSLHATIKKYQIVGLPDGKMNYKGGLTHSDNIQFEIVESGIYHFYEFYSPDYYRFIDSNANKVYSFLNHLNQQAGIRFYKGEHDFIYE